MARVLGARVATAQHQLGVAGWKCLHGAKMHGHGSVSGVLSRSLSLSARAAEMGVKFYQFSFTDMFGVQRSKLVPASRADEMAAEGAGFAGFAVHLKMTPTDGDLLAVPDLESLKVLPWNREVAWLACDLHWRGSEFSASPRNTLRRVLADLKETYGLSMKTGVECEFALLDASGKNVADTQDTQAKPCYDAHALMRQYDVVKAIATAVEELGFGPYQCDHEDANGQFEINFDYADALKTADNVVFFKYLVRSVAEAHGLRATFMPKVSADLTGNGCHAHISLHDAETGRNIVGGGIAPLGLSSTACSFVAGVLDLAPALAAVANPTVNSYKRIYAASTLSGATWSPNVVCWGDNNRTVMCRVPDDKRFELRLADMAVNQYLFPAAVAVAGMSGMKARLEPSDPAPVGTNMYDPNDANAAKIRATAPKLPRTLRDALGLLDQSDVLRDGLGHDLVDAYLYLKHRHCDEFDAQVTAWEVEQYLDV